MTDAITWTRVQTYLEELVPPRHDELRAMEARARSAHFPIIGPACGQLCYQLARTIRAQRVFELGSGFGYSTAWFAMAVRDNGGGSVHHVVWDEQLSTEARSRLARMGLSKHVQFHVAEAVQTLRNADGPFDIIFNDIDKDGYPAALDVIERKLKPGGLLIVDNLLWHGRVLDDADQSGATRGVRELTRRVFGDLNWIPSIVPIRDGMLVATRRPADIIPTRLA
ncbi:MAG: O-methyltransferase [Polyangiaceae bacterium]|nr:O-methyltransferase [Polyangiaceae bacterium]